MYSEPSSGIKLTAYSCICWLFHRIYSNIITQFPVFWMHWPLETWHHTVWHTDTNLSEKRILVCWDMTLCHLVKGFCVFLSNKWPWFSGIHRPMIHWSLEDEAITVLCNIRKHLPSNTLSHRRRPQCHNFSALRLSTWHYTYLRRHVKLSWWWLWTLLCVMQRYCCLHHHAWWWRLQYLWNVNTYPVHCMGSHTWT